MIQIKLIFSIIRSTIFVNIGLAFLYSFLFIVFFLVTFVYFFSQYFFAANYDKNYLEISPTNKIEKEGIDYEFVDSFTKEFPKAEVFPSFLLRIPTMMSISFFGKTLETDTFLMGYPKTYIKDKHYKAIAHKNTEGKIGLSISNETLLILKNFLFSELSADTLGFFEGNIVFGRSSIFGKIGDTHPVSEKFYIEGVSNNLPMYALAMDIDDALSIMKQFGKTREKIQLHSVHIYFKTEEQKNMYEQYIQSYSKKVGIPYTIKDSQKEVQELKDTYESVFFAVLGGGGIFFLICIIVITELSLQNLLHRSKDIVTVALYSQIPRIKILALFGGILCFIGILSSLITGGLLYLIFMSVPAIFSGFESYLGYVFLALGETKQYFFLFVAVFCLYYIISLMKKIYKVQL